jgi:stage III sporulation protein SpoIIIAA
MPDALFFSSRAISIIIARRDPLITHGACARITSHNARAITKSRAHEILKRHKQKNVLETELDAGWVVNLHVHRLLVARELVNC